MGSKVFHEHALVSLTDISTAVSFQDQLMISFLHYSPPPPTTSPDSSRYQDAVTHIVYPVPVRLHRTTTCIRTTLPPSSPHCTTCTVPITQTLTPERQSTINLTLVPTAGIGCQTEMTRNHNTASPPHQVLSNAEILASQTSA